VVFVRDLARKKEMNEGIFFEYTQVNQDNIIEAHRKLDTLDGKADMTLDMLETLDGKVDEALERLEILELKLDEANRKLDILLCPFGTTGLETTVIGQGCDGIDQDCNLVFGKHFITTIAFLLEVH